MVQQGIRHFTHHTAFRRKTVPVQHAALMQPRRQIDKLALLQLAFDLQMRDHTAGGALSRQLHKGLRGINDMARDAAGREIKVLLQEGLVHIVEMIKRHSGRFEQGAAGDAIGKVTRRERRRRDEQIIERAQSVHQAARQRLGLNTDRAHDFAATQAFLGAGFVFHL